MITLMYQTRHLNNTNTVLGHVDIYNIMLTILTYCHHIYLEQCWHIMVLQLPILQFTW